MSVPDRDPLDPPCPCGIRGALRGAIRSLAPVLLFVALACGQGSDRPPSVADEVGPNVILVVIDALRQDHLGFHGYDKPTSPFLDSLASQSLVFEKAFSHGSQTFQSTASLMTSRYFPYLVPRGNTEQIEELDLKTSRRHARVPILAPENVTLAEAFQECGYQTFGAFTNPHHHSTSGFWQGFDEALYLKPERRSAAYARGGVVRQSFLDWHDTQTASEPYFAYLHFMDVHNPYRPPRFLRRQFVVAEGRDRYINGIPTDDQTPTKTDLEFMQALYDAEIRFVDLVLEQLLTDLSDRGEEENTVLIVTSDHGDEFMEHGGLGHGKHLQPAMLRVPLIIAGLPLESRRIQPLVRQIDLGPTLLDLSGCPVDQGFVGKSLRSPLLDPDTTRFEVQRSFAMISQQRSLTSQDWHVTRDLKLGTTRLFDLRSDPGGHDDVSSQQPQVVQSFLQELDVLEEMRVSVARMSRQLQSGTDRQSIEGLDPEIRRQLEALGYLEN